IPASGRCTTTPRPGTTSAGRAWITRLLCEAGGAAGEKTAQAGGDICAGAGAASTSVIARLDRATQYSRDHLLCNAKRALEYRPLAIACIPPTPALSPAARIFYMNEFGRMLLIAVDALSSLFFICVSQLFLELSLPRTSWPKSCSPLDAMKSGSGRLH